jgi:hypothetical protein
MPDPQPDFRAFREGSRGLHKAPESAQVPGECCEVFFGLHVGDVDVGREGMTGRAMELRTHRRVTSACSDSIPNDVPANQNHLFHGFARLSSRPVEDCRYARQATVLRALRRAISAASFRRRSRSRAPPSGRASRMLSRTPCPLQRFPSFDLREAAAPAPNRGLPHTRYHSPTSGNGLKLPDPSFREFRLFPRCVSTRFTYRSRSLRCVLPIRARHCRSAGRDGDLLWSASPYSYSSDSVSELRTAYSAGKVAASRAALITAGIIPATILKGNSNGSRIPDMSRRTISRR